MKKLAAFSVVLGAVLSGDAMAADVVLVFCGGLVQGTQASAGVTLPASCAVGSSCAQCFADLLTNRFTLQASPSGAGTFFVFSRGGGGTGHGERIDRP